MFRDPKELSFALSAVFLCSFKDGAFIHHRPVLWEVHGEEGDSHMFITC